MKGAQSHSRAQAAPMTDQAVVEHPVGGRLSVGWQLLITIAGLGAVLWGGSALLRAGFDAWLAAQGITAATIGRAPLWAQWIVRYGEVLIFTLVYGLAIVVCRWMRTEWRVDAPRNGNETSTAALSVKAGYGKGLLGGGLRGLGAAIALCGLYTLLDSARWGTHWNAPMITSVWPLMIVYLASQAALLASIARGLLYPLGRRVAPWVGYGLVIVAQIGLSGWYKNGIELVNAVALAVLSCRWYAQTKTLAREIGFCFALTATMQIVAGFPSGAAQGALYELYPVSELWLTGGYRGFASGIGLTLWLLAENAWAIRGHVSTLRLRRLGTAAGRPFQAVNGPRNER